VTYPPPYGWNPNDQPPPGAYPPPSAYPPPMGGFPPPPAANRTNGMAIGALICSIAGLVTCAASSIVGVILGIIALNQIKETGEEGRGMALAGIIIGGVVTALIVIGVIAYFAFFVWLINESSYDYSTY
jgi:hypothetical protein